MTSASSSSSSSQDRLGALQHHLVPTPVLSAPSPSVGKPKAKAKAAFSAFRVSRDLEAAIPGPWELADPVYGHMKVLDETFGVGKAHLMMKEWRDKYGPVYGYYSYEKAYNVVVLRIVLSDPVEVRRLLRENPPKAKGYEQSIILGEGVLSNTNPQEWARQRAIIKPAFTTEALKDLHPVVKSGAATLAKELAHAHDQKLEFDMHEVLSAYAFLIIGHSALGEEDEFLDRRAKALRGAFVAAALHELNRSDVANIPEYQQARADIEDFTRETFLRYEEGQRESEAKGCPYKNPHSIISIIAGKDANGQPLFNQKQKADQLSTFMFAGHETTAHTMSWSVIEISRNPKVLAKLQAEIDKLLGEIGGIDKLTYSDTFKFTYLTQVINETLRLWPVVSTGTLRQLHEDTEVLGKVIPKGAVINFSHFNVHRDEKVWGPTANEFDPDRPWHNDSFIPFTVFPRDCLGRHLAMLEMRLTLITIFSTYNVHLTRNKVFKGFSDITMHPENGVWIRLEKRKN